MNKALKDELYLRAFADVQTRSEALSPSIEAIAIGRRVVSNSPALHNLTVQRTLYERIRDSYHALLERRAWHEDITSHIASGWGW